MAVTEVVMPTMGADMKEGTVLKWRKAEGDEVNRGDIIAEIETDKANVEIEAFGGGVFRKILTKEGDTVPVGTIIAVIAAAADDIAKYGAVAAAPAAPAAAPAAPAAAPTPAPSAPPTAVNAQAPVAAPAAPAMPVAVSAPPAPAPTGDGRMRVSPVARRVAADSGVDLNRLTGTGPDGRIVKRDVEAAAAAGPATSSAPAAAMPWPSAAPSGEDHVEDVPMSRMRGAVARNTQLSKQTIPHYYLSMDIDMTEAVKLRAQLNATLGDRGRVTVNDMVVQGVAKALVMHPKFNAYWVDDHPQRHSQVNIGVAVALDDGLIAPAIMDTANKGLAQIAREAKDVADRARKGGLRPEEYSAATFNTSNVGSFGIDSIVAIITPPQVGVLGIGAVKERPVVKDGEIVIRSMMTVILSADHRVTDGADGARFLATIRQNLENPGMMLL